MSASLLCFTLVSPTVYEVALLDSQLRAGIGLFDCDEWAVFSNTSTRDLSSLSTNKSLGTNQQKLRTRLVNGSLSVPRGGQYASLLNTPSFIRVWRRLIQEGRYRKHAWIVKVDLDTAFRPDRLRQRLATRDPDSGLYLLNGLGKLWGPIEVLSRQAMKIFAAGAARCEESIHYEDKGEDWYLHLCLDMLGLQGATEPHLLNLKRRSKSPCNSTHVAFHPFKREASLLGCLRRASSWTVTAR